MCHIKTFSAVSGAVPKNMAEYVSFLFSLSKGYVFKITFIFYVYFNGVWK